MNTCALKKGETAGGQGASGAQRAGRPRGAGVRPPDADIAHAMMGINAVKGVEIGDGFAVVEQKARSTGTR